MDENGIIAETLDFDTFGKIMGANVTTDLAYQYTGQEYDDEIGLHNYRARFYDDDLMRFYAIDPAEEFSSPYLYCGNDPINFVDPDGREIYSTMIKNDDGSIHVKFLFKVQLINCSGDIIENQLNTTAQLISNQIEESFTGQSSDGNITWEAEAITKIGLQDETDFNTMSVKDKLYSEETFKEILHKVFW